MLTIIENESNVWMVISVDDQLRVYSRTDEGDWGELSVSQKPEDVDPEKGFMLEELFSREDEGGDGEEGELDDEDQAPDDDEPELEQADEPEGDDDDAQEEEQKPRRRRAAAPRNGRSASARK